MALQIALGVVSSVLGGMILAFLGTLRRYLQEKRKVAALTSMLRTAESNNRLLGHALQSQIGVSGGEAKVQ